MKSAERAVSDLKVAITQETIGGGGRIAVIIEMISVLNELGVTPDIISLNMNISKEDMESKYGRSVNFNFIKVGPTIRKLEELRIVWFNFITRKYLKKYDLVIDSNNTTCLMPKKIPILTYIYYPRKDRVYRRKSIHEPDFNMLNCKKKLGRFIDNLLTKPFYLFDTLYHNRTVTTLSEFSKTAILARYKINPDSIKVIYPPVDLRPYSPNKKKNNSVASIGRFAPSKRQFTQIQIAEKVPELFFHIMGFSRLDDPYFLRCQQYISDKKIKNVRLYPSINFSSLKEILESAKYFLHTLTNEPFGITTVQGIAAGCIPVVPNSGGQVEVVPKEELRFDSIDQAIKIFKILFEKNSEKISTELQTHIKKFDTEHFKRAFKEKLYSSLIEIIGEENVKKSKKKSL